MIVKAFASTLSKVCEAGEPAQRGDQYFIKLQMKALYVDRSSDVPRKDFA